MSATCSRRNCLHPIEAHGDRAVFPACEGTNWPPRRLLEWKGSADDGTGYWHVTPAKRIYDLPICTCEGFR